MDTKVKKLYTDPPFSLRFVALEADGIPLDAPDGALVITPSGDDIAKAVVRPDAADVIDFTLNGQSGEQTFRISDGVASAGLLLIVHQVVEVDARLEPVEPTPEPEPQSLTKGVTNAA